MSTGANEKSLHSPLTLARVEDAENFSDMAIIEVLCQGGRTTE